MLGKKLNSFFKKILLFLVLAYRGAGAAHFGGGCRFQPSCSEYALEALEKHSVFDSIRLITKRLMSCRPGGPFGSDPVPSKRGTKRMHLA